MSAPISLYQSIKVKKNSPVICVCVYIYKQIAEIQVFLLYIDFCRPISMRCNLH